MIQVKKNEATAALRRMYFHCVDATDGITPETGEAGGQPQISYPGAEAFSNTGIGVLVALGNGRYYAELTQAVTNIADRSVIEGRYKSANTAEALGTTVQITDPMADIVEGALTFKQVIRIMLSALAGKTTGGGTATVTFRDVADAKPRITATVASGGTRSAVTLDGTD